MDIGTYNTPIIAYPCSGLHLLELMTGFLEVKLRHIDLYAEVRGPKRVFFVNEHNSHKLRVTILGQDITIN
jgi:hypothetical protein